LGFALETAEDLRVAGNILRQELKCDETSKASVFRLEDHTHTAATDLFDDAVMRDGLTDQ
jgi:hypothetical protein